MSGNFFQRRREELKLTQRQIAEPLGMTDTAVSLWERGANWPSVEIWEKLAAVYKVPVSRISEACVEMARVRGPVRPRKRGRPRTATAA